MAVEAGLDPEMTIVGDRNAQFPAFRDGRPERLGAKPLPEPLELAAEREEDKEGGEDPDPVAATPDSPENSASCLFFRTAQ